MSTELTGAAGWVYAIGSLVVSLLTLAFSVWTFFFFMRLFAPLIGSLVEYFPQRKHIGGIDARKKKGIDLPTGKQIKKRISCKHLIVARVKTREGVRTLCSTCGKDLHANKTPEEWV